MIVSILKEKSPEKRVSVDPINVQKLLDLKVENVWVEKDLGETAYFSDDEYKEAGAQIKSRADILAESNVIICINPLSVEELKGLKKDQVLISQFDPLNERALAEQIANLGLTSFSMDIIPRTTRAQAMDVLSSQASIAGYKAGILAADSLPRFYPLMMTAAGTLKPSKVLILGAGVAGLQAIATCKRLGAVVEAFDVRSAAKEEVMSLGAKFVEVEGAKDDADAGGYAVEQTEEFLIKQKALVQTHASNSDIVISTAQIPGRKAPLLITEETVQNMRPGSVIIDMAASSGGNCAMTKSDETINCHGVTIIGDSFLPRRMAQDSSRMLGKNLTNFITLILKDGELALNFDDDIVEGTCLTHNNRIVSQRVQQFYQN